MGNAVETWLDALAPENRALIDRLRAIVRSAAPGLTETIKWNAPSYADGDADRVTLGLERKGGVRVVLHRGASVKDGPPFHFEDPDRLAAWPSPDRGVATFRRMTEVDAVADRLAVMIRRWVEATRDRGDAE